jgi:uncharacterized OsmC-like protein
MASDFEGTVVASELHQGKFAQKIEAAGHELIADEPKNVGGNDLGPGPYDYLGAALAACTSMTIRLYADHKKLPLTHISVAVRHERIHAADCATCDTAPPPGSKIDRFTREITLEGALDGEQRKRLLEIADKCPVHKTLHGPIDIVTRLAS